MILCRGWNAKAYHKLRWHNVINIWNRLTGHGYADGRHKNALHNNILWNTNLSSCHLHRQSTRSPSADSDVLGQFIIKVGIVEYENWLRCHQVQREEMIEQGKSCCIQLIMQFPVIINFASFVRCDGEGALSCQVRISRRLVEATWYSYFRIYPRFGPSLPWSLGSRFMFS